MVASQEEPTINQYSQEKERDEEGCKCKWQEWYETERRAKQVVIPFTDASLRNAWQILSKLINCIFTECMARAVYPNRPNASRRGAWK